MLAVSFGKPGTSSAGGCSACVASAAACEQAVLPDADLVPVDPDVARAIHVVRALPPLEAEYVRCDAVDVLREEPRQGAWLSASLGLKPADERTTRSRQLRSRCVISSRGANTSSGRASPHAGARKRREPVLVIPEAQTMELDRRGARRVLLVNAFHAP